MKPATAGSSILNGWMLRRRGGWNRRWRARRHCLRHRPASSTRTATCNRCSRMRRRRRQHRLRHRGRRAATRHKWGRGIHRSEPSRRCGLGAVVNSRAWKPTTLPRSIEGFPREHIPACYGKGSYFDLTGKSPFARLIYPAPHSARHLGVHMTLDLSGAARFGPDLEWVESVDYGVDARRAPTFTGTSRVLARAGGRDEAGLRRNSSETGGSRDGGRGFLYFRPCRPWRGRHRESLGDGIARIDVFVGAGGAGRVDGMTPRPKRGCDRKT